MSFSDILKRSIVNTTETATGVNLAGESRSPEWVRYYSTLLKAGCGEQTAKGMADEMERDYLLAKRELDG